MMRGITMSFKESFWQLHQNIVQKYGKKLFLHSYLFHKFVNDSLNWSHSDKMFRVRVKVFNNRGPKSLENIFGSNTKIKTFLACFGNDFTLATHGFYTNDLDGIRKYLQRYPDDVDSIQSKIAYDNAMMIFNHVTEEEMDDAFLNTWEDMPLVGNEIIDDLNKAKCIELTDEMVNSLDEDDLTVEDGIVDDEESFTFVITPDSISITRITDDDVDTAVIDNKHEHFKTIFQQILQFPDDKDVIKESFLLINKKIQIETITEGRVTVLPEENKIVITDGEESRSLSGNIVERIIEAVTQNDNKTIKSLMRFADRLIENPSFRAVNELYDFLKAKDIKIAEDGRVICYKRVDTNYKDCKTGTFDNSPGKIVKVRRNMVDENSDVTCSYGLHVCSFAYLNSYHGAKVLRVLVDPKDFVAIPKDYYSYADSGDLKAKARVCEYYVDSDITDTYMNDGELYK